MRFGGTGRGSSQFEKRVHFGQRNPLPELVSLSSCELEPLLIRFVNPLFFPRGPSCIKSELIHPAKLAGMPRPCVPLSSKINGPDLIMPNIGTSSFVKFDILRSYLERKMNSKIDVQSHSYHIIIINYSEKGPEGCQATLQ